MSYDVRHISDVISAYVMAPARRDGAGWERQRHQDPRKAPMRSTMDSESDGFKLETGDQVEEEGEAGEYSGQYLKAGTLTYCVANLTCVAHGGRIPKLLGQVLLPRPPLTFF